MDDNQIKLLVGLIETNNKHINDRLIQHVDDNKEDINELKNLIKEDMKANSQFFKESYQLINKRIDCHEAEIQKIKTDSKTFVKANVCEVNEKMINDSFNKLYKRVVILNAIFIIAYIIVLYNSNIIIDWNSSIFAFLNLRKLFGF